MAIGEMLRLGSAAVRERDDAQGRPGTSALLVSIELW